MIHFGKRFQTQLNNHESVREYNTYFAPFQSCGVHVGLQLQHGPRGNQQSLSGKGESQLLTPI